MLYLGRLRKVAADQPAPVLKPALPRKSTVWFSSVCQPITR
jgi:hypothetical protein